jgi:hypothetical protein
MIGRRLRFVAGRILAVGLASAIWIYLTAVSSPGDAPGYAPEESRQY